MSTDLGQRISVSRAQAAEMVGLSTRSIVRAINAGHLIEHYPVSGKAVILVDDLRAWISAAPTEAHT